MNLLLFAQLYLFIEIICLKAAHQSRDYRARGVKGRFLQTFIFHSFTLLRLADRRLGLFYNCELKITAYRHAFIDPTSRLKKSFKTITLNDLIHSCILVLVTGRH